MDAKNTTTNSSCCDSSVTRSASCPHEPKNIPPKFEDPKECCPSESRYDCFGQLQKKCQLSEDENCLQDDSNIIVLDPGSFYNELYKTDFVLESITAHRTLILHYLRWNTLTITILPDKAPFFFSKVEYIAYIKITIESQFKHIRSKHKPR